MPDRRPTFAVTTDFGSFVARWQPALEAVEDAGARIVGGAVLDLAYQLHAVRAKLASWETAQMELLDEVFGSRSMIDGHRRGGALTELEARIMARLDAQDAQRNSTRKRDRRWLVGMVVTVVSAVAAMASVIVALLR